MTSPAKTEVYKLIHQLADLDNERIIERARKRELRKLGPNAQKRLERIARWLRRYKAPELNARLFTANDVRAMERLIQELTR